MLQTADPAHKLAEVDVGYGAFLNTVIQFLIVAFVVFLMIKLLNSVRRQEAKAPTAAACADARPRRCWARSATC